MRQHKRGPTVTIVRIGSNSEYADNFDAAFGKTKKKKKATTKKTTAKKKATKKKAAKKKKAGKK